jgi:uncharacterized membrane protein
MQPQLVVKRSGLAGVVFGLASVTVGLVAGLFFLCAVGLMPALAKTDDEVFVDVMRKINAAVETNAAFLASFLGAFVLTGSAAFLQYRQGGARAAFRWALAGFALYVVTFVVTAGINVPLNNALAAGALDKIDLAAARGDYEGPWVAANTARTITCTLALACVARASWLSRREPAA